MKFLFLFFISSSIFGQNINVKKYHLLVNDAELSISSHNLPKALKKYEKAFKYHNSHFVFDLHNAFLTACNLNKIDLSKKYGSQLILKGVPKSYFNQKCFQCLNNNSKWDEFFSSNYDSLHNEYLKKINENLRKSIENLNNFDQKYRGPQKNNNLENVDQTVNDSLIFLLQKYGYPTEDKVGIWMTNDSTISYNSPFDIMILHQFQTENGKDFISTLKNAVIQGNLKPVKLSFINGFINDEEVKFGCIENKQVVMYQINEFVYKCDCEKIKLIDKRREKYFLEPIKELIKKIDYRANFKTGYKLNIAYSFVSREVKLEKFDMAIKEIEDQGFKFFKKMDGSKTYY